MARVHEISQKPSDTMVMRELLHSSGRPGGHGLALGTEQFQQR